MSFSNRTYAVVDLSASPKPEIAWVNSMKAQGIMQTSFATARKSLDGTKMIIKWKHTTHSTPADAVAHIIFSGTHAEMRQYLVDNEADWPAADPLPPP